MRFTKNKKLLNLSMAALMVVSSVLTLGIGPKAHAAALTQVMARFDRMTTSVTTNGMVCATPNTASVGSTEAKVLVTFPTGFVLDTTAAHWTIDVATTTGWPTGGTAWPSIATATAVSGQTVTFPSGDLTSASTLYCFNWINNTTAPLTTPSSTGASELGTVATQTTGSTGIDSSQYATATIGTDQVNVSATVPPAFNFALSTGTDAFSTLTAGTVTPSGTAINATVNTNAKNGWTIFAKDLWAGLKSTTAAHTVASDCTSGVGTNSTLTTTAEGYNLGITNSSQTSGTGTIDIGATANYQFYGNATGKGGGLCATFQPIAASNGTANNAIVSFKNNINVVGSTPAASDYSDTITVVGAGLF